MRHNKSGRTHLFHDHHIVSKRKRETQSRCPELNAHCISEPIERMLISAICMGALAYHAYHSIHVSSIFRAAVAETLTCHRLQWCNEVQWAGNYSALPRSSNMRPGVITMRSQCWVRLGEKKKWPWMLFKGCHQKWVFKARNVRGPSSKMLSWPPTW